MKNRAYWLAILLSCSFLGTNLQAETTASGKAGAKGAAVSKKAPIISSATKDELFAIAMAGRIAGDCHRMYTLNVKQADLVYSQLDELMRKQGFNESNQADLSLSMPNHVMESKAQAYFRARNLRENSTATWCSAGQAEIAQKTKIGKYLLPK